jgi:hypothetical protein
MKVSIGKNTLGGGKKMTTRLNNYNRSTHDLSNVCRTSAAVGTLIPTLYHLVLPGDTFPIQARCHTLTHPTIGPLFGSFKQQNDFFFCPIRLYNAMLHNNALNIGLNMKQVKFPIYPIAYNLYTDKSKMKGSNDSLLNEVNPSSLVAYTGVRALSTLEPYGSNMKTFNCIKLMMYYDIFKNYYANKQEDKFYVISGNTYYLYKQVASSLVEGQMSITLANSSDAQSSWTVVATGIPNLIDSTGDYPKKNTDYQVWVLAITPYTQDKDSGQIEININMQTGWLLESGGTVGGQKTIQIYGTINNLIEKEILTDITEFVSNAVDGAEYYRINETTFLPTEQTFKTYFYVNKPSLAVSVEARYNSYELSTIDDMRENILTAGKTQYISQDPFIVDIFKPIQTENGIAPSCSQPLVGLALKTYQSDINTNWVNTEWIDGETGINAITAIDTSSGSFTLDTLNLAKKVYTMLNRIAVSDGSYNAWIQTVYTSGGLNHIETPLYLGGSSLEIEFQEVVNNSGTEDQPLGTLAGRGIATNHKGGNIVFKADEPGYIFCITSITPRVDYFQGNEWDNYLLTLDDLHKPQLDGIGFQDRLYRNVNANTPYAMSSKSIGKQPAWIEYMTNVNKTYGNFALVENEGWMCLNRIFGDISTYTTYVFPHLYNNIFADTDITAQNFWIQIAFNTNPRRVMSAKVIPNI